MIKIIEEYWGWIGIKPAKAIDENAFGNLIIIDEKGIYWRLCPEDLSCITIAKTQQEYILLKSSPDFQEDWNCQNWLAEAEVKYGPLEAGRKFCLKIPSILGGEYDISNFGTIDFQELIKVSGSMAKQMFELPDGSKIDIKVV